MPLRALPGKEPGCAALRMPFCADGATTDLNWSEPHPSHIVATEARNVVLGPPESIDTFADAAVVCSCERLASGDPSCLVPVGAIHSIPLW